MENEPHSFDSSYSVVFSVLIILLCVTSSVANPLVFLFNNRPPFSIAKFLFRVMSVTDFLTGIICSANYLSLFLDSSGKYHYENGSENVFIGHKIMSLLCWILMQFSYYVLSLIGCTRAIQIVFPLQHISPVLVYTCLFVALIWTVCLHSFLLFGHQKSTRKRFIPLIGLMVGGSKKLSMRGNFILYFAASIAVHIMSFLLSFVAVIDLVINRAFCTKNKKLCAVKIVILNFGSFVSMLLMIILPNIVLRRKDLFFPISFSMNSLPSVIQVAFDPIIFLLLTPKSQRFVIEGAMKLLFSKNREAKPTNARGREVKKDTAL